MCSRFLLLGLVLLSLAGCINFYGSQDFENNNIEFTQWKLYKDDCLVENEQCPVFTLNMVEFKNEPLLNKLVRQRLLRLLNPIVNEGDSLRSYQHSYLVAAQPGDSMTVDVGLVEQDNAMVVLELSITQTFSDDTYSPARICYVNFDKVKQQELMLSDILLASKQIFFEKSVYIAYENWLETNQLLNNQVFQDDWPFLQTDNIALLKDFLVLKYSANTLAPYAMGFPELFIPYNQLQDIIRPEYIPR